MKNFMFLVGPEGAGRYDLCRKLIDEKKINDLLVFDVDMFFKRMHYKKGVELSYKTWLLNFSSNEIVDLISSELKKRIEANGDQINNVIVSGDLSNEQIKQIAYNLSVNKYKTLFIDATKELIYRNLSLKSENEIGLEKFISDLDNLYTIKYNDLIKQAKDENSYFYKTNINDNLIETLGENLGYNIPKTQNNIMEKYIWPVEPIYKVIEHDRYGIRPVHMILGKPKFHSGFDITSRTLTPVRAAMDGVVVYSGLDERILSGQVKWNQRYGNMVEVVDNFGQKQLYAHLREVCVKEGGFVKQGEVLGLSGCSGGARIPHLHFEVRRYNVDHSGEKNTINPLELLPGIDLEKLDKKFDEKPYSEIWEKTLQSPFGLTDEEIIYSDSKDYIF